jgi:DNA-directed RNA polymerase subunit M/transcription elongation factor TFIIS
MAHFFQDERVMQLKRKIIWYCDADLISSNSSRAEGDESSANEADLLSALDKIVYRVYELTRSAQSAASLQEVENSNAPSRPQIGAQSFKCSKCGNKNSANIVRDNKSGDLICLGLEKKGCGMVLQDHLVDEGSEKRNFEDTEVS